MRDVTFVVAPNEGYVNNQLPLGLIVVSSKRSPFPTRFSHASKVEHVINFIAFSYSFSGSEVKMIHYDRQC